MSAISEFHLGERSSNRLNGCHPDLIAVIGLAIQITAVDFAVIEGQRSEAHQKKLFSQGKSRTLNSRHLSRKPLHQPELGSVAHAADLAGWVNGRVSWEWEHFFLIADAVKKAADFLKVPVRWGGCWDYLHHYNSAEDAYIAYIARKKKAGQTPFPDGPHFELCRKAYPV